MSEENKTYNIPSVNGVSAEDANKIRNMSAFTLPDRPSQQGMKPDQIKKRFYQPIIESDISVVNQMNRIVSEVNKATAAMERAVNELDEKREEMDKMLENKASKSEIAELKGKVEEIIDEFKTTTAPKAIKELEDKIDTAISTFEETTAPDAIASLEGKVDDAISNTEQTLMNVFAGNRKHVFTSRERFCIDNALPYSKLIGVEGSDKYNRSPNLIPSPYYWEIIGNDFFSGVNFSIDEDRAIILNGTQTKGTTIWFIHSSQEWKVEPDEYYLSGCPDGGNKSTFYVRLKAVDKNRVTVKDSAGKLAEWADYGNGVLCDLRGLEYEWLCLGIQIAEGQEFDGERFELQFERGDKKTAYVGKGYSEANKLPTRIEIENALGELVFEYQVSEGLLDFMTENGIGNKGIRIDFENRKYIRKDNNEAYDITDYIDNSSRYFAIFPEDYVVRIFSGDELLHFASCDVMMQHTVGNTLKVGATEISEDVLKSLLALPGDIETALDELHNYAQALIGGGT